MKSVCENVIGNVKQRFIVGVVVILVGVRFVDRLWIIDVTGNVQG